MILYHGTNNLNIKNMEKFNYLGISDIFFTPYKAYASLYAFSEVRRAFVKRNEISKPLLIRVNLSPDFIKSHSNVIYENQNGKYKKSKSTNNIFEVSFPPLNMNSVKPMIVNVDKNALTLVKKNWSAQEYNFLIELLKK